MHITGICVPDKEKVGNGEVAANRIGKCSVKSKVSPRVDRKIVNFCKQNWKMTILQITNELKTLDLVVSERTVHRRLYEQDLKCHRPSRQALLSTTMKKKLHLWAKQHESFTFDDWKKSK